ncbi:hypothetical protein ACFSTE_13365 [Aquimarina hainanensis]|uniref:Uncharacterized protein n=1 Tax=Aquimarina hainanensis TaxID=1578017 RepID=A0ABW5N8N2_9FLAO
MIKSGNFKLKKVLKNRGLYCSIDFEVELNEMKSNNLIFKYEADNQWETASRLGGMIFYDYFLKKSNIEMSVTIKNIDWMPVDTNNGIIFYSVLKGLSEILSYPINDLEIDIEKESFIIPELRAI